MDTVKIGILSDTHLHQTDPTYKKLTQTCFKDVSIVLHAGDLTNLCALSVFKDKEVHAVHGNMCDFSTCKVLPTKKTIEVGGFKIGMVHRVGNNYDFESFLLAEFDDVDCIVYGHTHQPVIKKIGDILIINPGSFIPTGRYGAPGTYALLEVDTELRGILLETPH